MTPTLGAHRLTKIRKHGQTCGQCAKPLAIGSIVSWDSFGTSGNKWRCVEDSGCWSDKFSPEDIAGKKHTEVPEPAETPAETPVIPQNGHSTAGLDGILRPFADALAPYLDSRLKAKVDEQRVLDLIEQAIRDAATRVILKSDTEYEWKDLGIQHKQFPLLLRASDARTPDGRLNIWLTGPAGSGKTTAARNVAKALDLPFHFTGAISDAYQLIGFMDANGKYVRTQFREAWEHGGVFLFDEVDGSDPNAVLAFNAALANGVMAFPDSTIPRHKDCVIIACANTWGLGGTNDYVGRLKMDAAFLDRFVRLSWDVDEQLETTTAPDRKWCARVQEIRHRIREKGIKVLVTPRATYYGSALLAAGMTWDDTEQMALKCAMTADQWNSVKG